MGSRRRHMSCRDRESHVHTARPNRVLPFGQKAPNIITTPIKNRPEDLFFKLLRTMRQWGPAHGQCSDLCLSKLWDRLHRHGPHTMIPWPFSLMCVPEMNNSPSSNSLVHEQIPEKLMCLLQVSKLLVCERAKQRWLLW